MIFRTLKVGRKHIRAVCIKLGEKNLILLYGKRGYVMCGYLNLGAANKFKDKAVVVTGVSTIADVLRKRVGSLSQEAKKIGIKKGQLIKDVLKIIA